MQELHILSGGMDSVAVLYQRLRETKNEIHVLHLMTFDGFAIPELRASRNAAIWLTRNVRPFIYREIEMLTMVGKACGNNVFAQCGYALGEYVVRNPTIQLIVQGSNGGPADLTPDSIFRNNYREGVCAAVCNGYAPVPKWIYPNKDRTKAEVMQTLPPDLLALCWSCNFPKLSGDTYTPCGKCDKCLEFQSAEEGVA